MTLKECNDITQKHIEIYDNSGTFIYSTSFSFGFLPEKYHKYTVHLIDINEDNNKFIIRLNEKVEDSKE